jgi:hypothetical protein
MPFRGNDVLFDDGYRFCAIELGCTVGSGRCWNIVGCPERRSMIVNKEIKDLHLGYDCQDA